MKKFIKTTAIFLGITTLVMIVLDLAVTYQAQHSKQRVFANWNPVIKGGIDADLVILGNSRAWTHYSPTILDSILGCNSWNLGMDGSEIDRQYRKYSIYRNHNAKPKVLIQNIDRSTITHTWGYERHQFFPYFYLQEVRDAFFPIDTFSWAEKYLPMYRYANFGLDKLFDKKSYTLTKGYSGLEWTWGDAPEINQWASSPAKFTDVVIDLMDSHLAKAKAEGIQVVMVFSPIYYELLEVSLDMDKFWDYVNGWSQKYDIPILDYSHDSLCYDTAYFYNANHLNRRGSELFSIKLGNDLKALNLFQ